MKRLSRTIGIDTISIEWRCGMNDQKKFDNAWSNTLFEKYYPRSNLGDLPQNSEYIVALVRNICGPLGIFLSYFVSEILVSLAYEYEKTNYPTKYEEMINRSPIFTSADTGTNMEKTKDGPFHKDFSVDMNVLWYIMRHVFGVTKVWMHAKHSSRIKKGRYEFFLLMNYLLGSHYITNMEAQLDTKMHIFYYDGEKKCFTFFQNFVNLKKG